MKKIDVVFNKLSNDKIILNEFLKRRTLDDMYEFCLTIDKSVTREEFDEYVSEAFVKYNKSLDKKIDELDLGKVSGGVTAENILMKAIVNAADVEAFKTSLEKSSSPLNNFVVDSFKQ